MESEGYEKFIPIQPARPSLMTEIDTNMPNNTISAFNLNIYETHARSTPRYLTVTTDSLPGSADEHVNLSFGFIFRPLAPVVEAEEDPIPVIDRSHDEGKIASKQTSSLAVLLAKLSSLPTATLTVP